MKRISMVYRLFVAVALLTLSYSAKSQSQLYPQHFDLDEVTLLDGPFKTSMDKNIEVLLKYDVNRLLTPFVRQSGLSSKSGSKYYGWVSKYPSFINWGQDSWSLEGHVGGHYLTALSLAYAACHDEATKSKLKQKLDYALGVMKDCQDAYDNNTQGLYGFIGGQPINQVWTGLYKNDLTEFRKYGGWVPFYCQHKVLAGLRDAWVYTGSEVAKECFRKLADWSVNVVSKLSTSDMQNVLGWEHGGMNESMLDAYQIFGDPKYLSAAKKYSHQHEIDGMQGAEGRYSTSFLNGQHANTQVPKFIGFQRIGETSASAGTFRIAARNFWDDVATNRTVCIGGNSVSEHFLAKSNASQYITNTEGPESCNTNNMLKLSEMLFDYTHNAKYADFYEYATWNHILSTQDPQTGGYVYFTSLRPQSYRIYSQVNKGMWCCVGTGMENHSKYGHFIYTHDGTSTLYVNLFTPSELKSTDFAIKQETNYPYEQKTRLTVGKSGEYTIAIRHPWWTTEGYSISVNGSDVNAAAQKGTSSYAGINRKWKEGDVIEVTIPMELRVETCPGYNDYVAFEYGPILLAAQTTAAKSNDGSGLVYEKLQNEYAGEGRMDHSPGAVGKSLSLSSAPLLLGERQKVLNRIKELDLSKLQFSIDVSNASRAGVEKWTSLTLVPFYSIQHARYQCYWYQQTEEAFANSDMARQDAMEKELQERTIDFVGTGEQQSEAGHDASYSSGSTTGVYNDEYYRDARSNGFIQYTLYNPDQLKDNLSVMLRFTTADSGRKGKLYVDGVLLSDIEIVRDVAGADDKGFFNVEYPLSESLIYDEAGKVKTKFVVMLKASSSTLCPGWYFVRLLRGYDNHAYRFTASEWTTGDTNRLKNSNIRYNSSDNTIVVSNSTGANNVCLTLDYKNKGYTIGKGDKYLIVRGTGLSTDAGSSFLWWLNGVNRGSSVAPDYASKVGDSEVVIAWDMTASGLADNLTGDRPDVCIGSTIFGLTAKNTTVVIHDIGFYPSVTDYVDMVSSVGAISVDDKPMYAGVYTVQGVKVSDADLPSDLPAGVYIKNGKKHLKKK